MIIRYLLTSTFGVHEVQPFTIWKDLVETRVSTVTIVTCYSGHQRQQCFSQLKTVVCFKRYEVIYCTFIIYLFISLSLSAQSTKLNWVVVCHMSCYVHRRKPYSLIDILFIYKLRGIWVLNEIKSLHLSWILNQACFQRTHKIQDSSQMTDSP